MQGNNEKHHVAKCFLGKVKIYHCILPVDAQISRNVSSSHDVCVHCSVWCGWPLISLSSTTWMREVCLNVKMWSSLVMVTWTAEKCWTGQEEGYQKTLTRWNTHEVPRQPAESGDIWHQLLNVKTTSCCCLYNRAVSEWKHVRARCEGPDKISSLWSLSKSWQLITPSLQNKLISAPQLWCVGRFSDTAQMANIHTDKNSDF